MKHRLLGQVIDHAWDPAKCQVCLTGDLDSWHWNQRWAR